MIVTCVSCGLRLFVLRSDICRRCRAPLARQYSSSTWLTIAFLVAGEISYLCPSVRRSAHCVSARAGPKYSWHDPLMSNAAT